MPTTERFFTTLLANRNSARPAPGLVLNVATNRARGSSECEFIVSVRVGSLRRHDTTSTGNLDGEIDLRGVSIVEYLTENVHTGASALRFDGDGIRIGFRLRGRLHGR